MSVLLDCSRAIAVEDASVVCKMHAVHEGPSMFVCGYTEYLLLTCMYVHAVLYYCST